MQAARILMNRAGIKGEHPCHRFLPIDIEREGVSVGIYACSTLAQGSGYSLIRITDPGDSMETGHHVFEDGECTVSRLSSTQYIAMVLNHSCLLCSLVNQSGCFLSSAVPLSDTEIQWTIVGPDDDHLVDLFRTLRKNGYEFQVVASESLVPGSVLSPKQEEYFRRAYDMGYYDVPKRTDLDTIANSLGVSKSSLNVTLRTAERNIFRFYSDSYMGPLPVRQ